METETSLASPEKRFKPCDCCDFNPMEWPWRNAILKIRKCMDRCVYCGKKFSPASRLRRHLKKSKEHEAQQFTIVSEDAGRPPRKNIQNSISSFKSNRRSYSASNLSTISAHEEQILHLEREAFDDNVIRTFQKLNLSTVHDISPEMKELWIKYNGRMPSKLDARRCWTDERPSDAKLFAATIEQIQNSSVTCTVIQRGEPTDEKKAIQAVAQLAFPDPWNPLKILDLRLPILRNDIFMVPNDLVCSYEVDNLQVLLTPKYSWSQLHFDNADGLSSIIGKTGRKIFATFPNSPNNIRLFRSTLGREAKLEEIGPSLEGGLTFTITSDDAIDLPGNCFHAVWTLEGGFLATLDFTTPSTTKGYSRIISAGLDEFIGTMRQKDLFDWFLTSLEIAFKNEYVDDAVSSWIELLDRTTEWAHGHHEWAKKAADLCEKFLSSPASLDQICPCGGGQGKAFRQHFRDYHLQVLHKRQHNKSNKPQKKLCR
ncbi:6f84c146-6972-41d6-b92b-bd7f8c8dfd45 [Sclerotinia trifoliorum]|uniref:6f84c146-6972-41d6-b92b-bd7f8c8dfd45 n=1 Tax=Sclerotinia trifoliorum TaxID=28548 RepID=A0A8H2VYC9_9HELO|nr:6f84c146-6972-41d6-b92b-bd7f8c8dfd45 [Sclerotinia trifoliorum]